MELKHKLAAYTTRAQQPTSLGTPTLGLYQPRAPKEQQKKQNDTSNRSEATNRPQYANQIIAQQESRVDWQSKQRAGSQGRAGRRGALKVETASLGRKGLLRKTWGAAAVLLRYT